METTFFYFFSGLALFSALIVVSAGNPVHSVLFLVLVFCNATGLLLLLEVDFLAMIFLVVYVGAIAVLFLFVVMMLSPKVGTQGDSRYKGDDSWLPAAVLLGTLFLGEFVLVVRNPEGVSNISEEFQANTYSNWINVLDGAGSSTSNIEVLGQVLYTHYFYFFLVAGFILLVAMIGAIVLTLQSRQEHKSYQTVSVNSDQVTGAVKRQQVFEQLSRSPETAVFLVDRN